MGYIMVNVLASDGISTSVSHQTCQPNAMSKRRRAASQWHDGLSPTTAFLLSYKERHPYEQNEEANSIA